MTNAFDRRDFLAASGAAVAATSIASSVAEAVESKPEPRFLKSVKSGMVKAGKNLTEKFQLLVDVGFDGVDVSQRHKHEEVLEAKEKSGLTVHGVVGYDHWSIPLSHPDLATRKKGLKSSAISPSSPLWLAWGWKLVVSTPGGITSAISGWKWL